MQGISAELGAFLAGVMLSATDQQEAIVAGLAPVSRLFLALFVASTGLVLSPRFLAHHLPVLAAGVLVVIIAKAGLVSCRGLCQSWVTMVLPQWCGICWACGCLAV